MTLYVPAWKRLGLKLKYANDLPQPDRTRQGKRSSSTEAVNGNAGLTGHSAKRQRLAQETSSEAELIEKENLVIKDSIPQRPVNNASEDAARSNSNVTDNKSTKSRRKSVSFTDDTKMEDGDSRITIDFPAGLPSQRVPNKEQDAGRSTTEASENQSEDIAKIISTSRKQKRSKQDKINSGQKLTSKDKSALALEYLSQHRSNRGSWKFNKNRDTWVLSHALDPQAIPSSHVLALAGYVQGLPNDAGARKRLINECKDALGDIQSITNHGHGKQEVLLALDGGQSTADATLNDLLENHSRPLILFWALGQDTSTLAEHTEARPAANGAPTTNTGQRVKKKKKSRVSASIEISSSESSSDSDSSISSNDKDSANKTTTHERNTVNGRAQAEDSTSSSGSSSESSSANSSESSGSDSDSQ